MHGLTRLKFSSGQHLSETDLNFILYKINYNSISDTLYRVLIVNGSVTLNKAAFYCLFVIYKLNKKEDVRAVIRITHLQVRAVYCATCFRHLLKCIIRYDKNTCRKIAFIQHNKQHLKWVRFQP